MDISPFIVYFDVVYQNTIYYILTTLIHNVLEKFVQQQKHTIPTLTIYSQIVQFHKIENYLSLCIDKSLGRYNQGPLLEYNISMYNELETLIMNYLQACLNDLGDYQELTEHQLDALLCIHSYVSTFSIVK